MQESSGYRKAILVTLFCLLLSSVAAAQGPQGATLKILTYNVYEGTDFAPVMALLSEPPDQQLAGFPAAVGASLEQVIESDPVARAAAIADQIARTHPDVVVLEEANSWQIALPTGGTFVFDFTTALMADLAKLGLKYSVADSANGFVLGVDAVDPSDYLPAVTTDHNVVLVSGGMHPGEIAVSNIQSTNFPDTLTLLLPIPGAPPPGVPITRDWISMSVSFRGYTFTLIGTHLEAFSPQATLGQAQYLVSSVATSGPMVLAGDFNANASDASDPTYAAYSLITQAGFTDAWDALHPGGNPPGYTCCQLTEVGENLTNFKSLFNQRIDHVFVRDLRVISARVIGREQSAKTASGLWPSDHGGLLVDIALK